MTAQAFYPIGTPGQPWREAEVAQWRARQVRQRSYAADVLAAVAPLRDQFDVQTYGHIDYGADHYPLLALHSRPWQPGLPAVLVTGGVHGYETSGVHGALRFAQAHAPAWAGRVNLLVVPCVSPWGYERIHRWNHDATDPNRTFFPHRLADAPGVPDAPQQHGLPGLAGRYAWAPESVALMRHVASVGGGFAAHIDLHETTDTDETEFRPAVAARDGKAFVRGTIPDGFYLVDDTEHPQPDFQAAIIDAVARVTHIAPADAQGQLIGSPMVAPGVIRYPLRQLGLCTALTGARWTTTTEVYPDSPRTTPAECVAAQVAAVQAALGFVVQHASGR